MKAYIKGGLFLALGWLTNQADGQEIQFRASKPGSVAPVAIAAPSNAVSNPTPIRAVSLSVPTMEASVDDATLRPIIRGQKPDEITITPIPKLEVGGKDGQPKPMPKDPTFMPPPPKSLNPSPVYDGLGMSQDGCSDGVADCCLGRGRGRGFSDSWRAMSDRRQCWASGEYLMWWQRAQSVPQLVTTSPNGTAFANAGVLGQAATSTLYDQTPNRTRGGGRFTLGTWLPHFDNCIGIDTSFFFIGRQAASATFSGNGTPILARPFIDENGQQNAEIFSFPNAFSGFATVSNYTQLWGMDANVRFKWHNGCNYWIDALVGYRYMNLSEGINITEDNTFGPLTLAPGLRVVENESFQTRNIFNGGQFGLAGEYRIHERFTVGWFTKVALGYVQQTVTIDGSTTFLNAPAPLVNGTKPGALLATPTNMGTYSANRFAVLPEVGINLGYDVTSNLRVFAGYNFLYLSSVVRPGEQIDLNSNQSFRPTPTAVQPTPRGPRVPAVLMRTNDYWAQGLTFGLQYRY